MKIFIEYRWTICAYQFILNRQLFGRDVLYTRCILNMHVTVTRNETKDLTMIETCYWKLPHCVGNLKTWRSEHCADCSAHHTQIPMISRSREHPEQSQGRKIHKSPETRFPGIGGWKFNLEICLEQPRHHWLMSNFLISLLCLY